MAHGSLRIATCGETRQNSCISSTLAVGCVGQLRRNAAQLWFVTNQILRSRGGKSKAGQALDRITGLTGFKKKNGIILSGVVLSSCQKTFCFRPVPLEGLVRLRRMQYGWNEACRHQAGVACSNRIEEGPGYREPDRGDCGRNPDEFFHSSPRDQGALGKRSNRTGKIDSLVKTAGHFIAKLSTQKNQKQCSGVSGLINLEFYS